MGHLALAADLRVKPRHYLRIAESGVSGHFYPVWTLGITNMVTSIERNLMLERSMPYPVQMFVFRTAFAMLTIWILECIGHVDPK